MFLSINKKHVFVHWNFYIVLFQEIRIKMQKSSLPEIQGRWGLGVAFA